MSTLPDIQLRSPFVNAQSTVKSHDVARGGVCCVCWRKVKKTNPNSGVFKVVSDNLSKLVRKFVFDGYSVQNTAHPTAICDTCRKTLTSLEKVSEYNMKRLSLKLDLNIIYLTYIFTYIYFRILKSPAASYPQGHFQTMIT